MPQCYNGTLHSIIIHQNTVRWEYGPEVFIPMINWPRLAQGYSIGEFEYGVPLFSEEQKPQRDKKTQ